MNILFVADVSISKVIGGAERVLFEQAVRMSRRGHNVHVLTRKLPDCHDDQEIVCGVREWRYDVKRQAGAVSFFKSIWQNSRQLFESLEHQIGFECIHFHQPFSAIGVVRSPMSRKPKKVYTCHSLSFEEYTSRNLEPKRVLGRLYYQLNIFARKWIERKALHVSDSIVGLSQFTKDKLVGTYHLPPEKISIIPGGVELEKFYLAGNKTALKRKLKLPEDKVILLTVRNLVQRMGLENLIEALACIIEKGPDVFMVIGGEGPLRKELEVRCEQTGLKKHVRFTGFIPEKLLPDYYSAADLFILPTKELEGFGLVTLEAMASGVPVLGTPVGGTREILSLFDAAFLFKSTSVEAMADLILDKYHMIKNDNEQWRKISFRCRRFVEEHYSWDQHVERLEKLF